MLSGGNVQGDIGLYRQLTPFTNENAGTSEWCRAERNAAQYFVKKFQSPVYPAKELGLPEAKFKARVAKFHESEEKRKKVYRALRENNQSGALVVPCEVISYQYHICAISDYVTGNIRPEQVCRLSEWQKVVLMRTLTVALLDVHRAGIVHSDMKPENVLITQNPENASCILKLIDFDGSFFASDPPKQITCDPAYLAPEVYAMESYPTIRPDDRMDDFALGLIFHYFWTGRLPEKEDGLTIGMSAFQGKTITIDPSIPQPLNVIIRQLLQPDPEQRMSLGEVYEKLGELLGSFPPRQVNLQRGVQGCPDKGPGVQERATEPKIKKQEIPGSLKKSVNKAADENNSENGRSSSHRLLWILLIAAAAAAFVIILILILPKGSSAASSEAAETVAELTIEEIAAKKNLGLLLGRDIYEVNKVLGGTKGIDPVHDTNTYWRIKDDEAYVTYQDYSGTGSVTRVYLYQITGFEKGNWDIFGVYGGMNQDEAISILEKSGFSLDHTFSTDYSENLYYVNEEIYALLDCDKETAKVDSIDAGIPYKEPEPAIPDDEPIKADPYYSVVPYTFQLEELLRANFDLVCETYGCEEERSGIYTLSIVDDCEVVFRDYTLHGGYSDYISDKIVHSVEIRSEDSHGEFGLFEIYGCTPTGSVEEQSEWLLMNYPGFEFKGEESDEYSGTRYYRWGNCLMAFHYYSSDRRVCSVYAEYVRE